MTQEESLGEKRQKAKEGMEEFPVLKSITTMIIRLRTMGKRPEELVGLLEGAIIAHPLCYPSSVDSLTYDNDIAAGRWAAWDFKRPIEFPKAKRQLAKGRLGALMLDELVDRPEHERTPTAPYIRSADGLFSLDFYPLSTLIESNLLRETTHREAYEAVGQGAHVQELIDKGMADNTAYQVTPKGNSLVFLAPDIGNPKPRQGFKFENSWLPIGLQPA